LTPHDDDPLDLGLLDDDDLLGDEDLVDDEELLDEQLPVVDQHLR